MAQATHPSNSREFGGPLLVIQNWCNHASYVHEFAPSVFPVATVEGQQQYTCASDAMERMHEVYMSSLSPLCIIGLKLWPTVPSVPSFVAVSEGTPACDSHLDYLHVENYVWLTYINKYMQIMHPTCVNFHLRSSL